LKLICFDCDSTLSSIEGIDELARLRGPDVFARVEAMTRDAMDGKIRMQDVFGLRLEAIRPGRQEAESVGRLYVENVEPTAKATIGILRAKGWTPVVVSAGFRQVIQPLAAFLGITRIEAVDLRFTADGAYGGFDTTFPSTRTGGKAEIVAGLRRELGAERIVMVGDGVSDLEAAPAADLFIGYGGYVARDRVRQGASAFVASLSAVTGLVEST
jgi:phosphoserine phosphatase